MINYEIKPLFDKKLIIQIFEYGMEYVTKGTLKAINSVVALVFRWIIDFFLQWILKSKFSKSKEVFKSNLIIQTFQLWKEQYKKFREWIK
jgi:hypothetical protein